MIKDELHIIQNDTDPFGLRRFDFSVRIPERSEMFDEQEVKTYIDECDYPESVDDLLLALEIENLFGKEQLDRMKILDAMCGPGRLGRDLLNLGAQHVVFHDGHETMIAHASNQAFNTMKSGQSIGFVISDVSDIPIADNTFDLVTCHNATHQLSDVGRLRTTMKEFLRITRPGGHIIVADYQRATTPEFFKALEERLKFTRPKVVPLLIPSFTASFSKEEFGNVLKTIPGIRKSSVIDAQPPILNDDLQKRIEADPVKGHIMDYSPISQRVIVKKARI